MDKVTPTQSVQSMNNASTAAGGGGWKPTRQRGNRRRSGRFIPQPKATFKGRCEELEGHVFDTGPTQATKFTKTKKEITEYVGRLYGSHVRTAIDEMRCVRPDIEAAIPVMDNTSTDPIAVEMNKVKVKRFVERLIQYEDDMRKVYSVIHGQCTDAMIQKLSADPTYDEAKAGSDPVVLLQLLQKICFKYESQVYPPLAAIRAMITICRTVQGDLTTDIDWLEQFENMVTAAEACGISFQAPGVQQFVLDTEYNGAALGDLTAQQQRNVAAATKDIMVSTLYIENSNQNRHAHLKKKLQNDYLVEKNNYPTNISDAQNLLINFKGESNAYRRNTTNDGIAFAQQGSTPKRDKSSITCYKCGKKGHYSYEGVCKDEDVKEYEERKASNTNNANADDKEEQDQGQSSTQCLNLGDIDNYNDTPYQMLFCTRGTVAPPHISYDTVLNLSKGHIDPSWLLLDNQSTVNVFCNPDLLTNIRKTTDKMYIHCNAGVATTDLVGDFQGFGTVWYHKDGIANILSLSKIRKTHFVSYVSHPDNTFRVYNKDGSKFREFRESGQGLYYSSMKHAATTLVTKIDTVNDKLMHISDLDHRRAEAARRLQDTINVSTKELLYLIDNGSIPNCPVTREDVKTAEQIYGKSLVALKGKTVRRPEPHVRVNIQPLPPSIIDKYGKVSIGADIMYVNGIRFFITISRHILFGTVEMIGDAKAATLERCLLNVKNAYAKRGLTLAIVNMDIQFKPIQNRIKSTGATTNFVSQDEHVPEIERYIRTIKGRTRGIQCTLPFTRIPGRMAVELVASQVFWWNSVPKPRGASSTMSPRTIVTGMTIDYNKHLKLRFGEYVQTHEMTDNDTRHERTIGAIALRPTGNAQGGFLFYSLKTGRVIARNRCTPLPMPNEVIDRVEQLARNYPEGVHFANRNGEEVLDDSPDDQEADEEDDAPQAGDDDHSDDVEPTNEHPTSETQGSTNPQVVVPTMETAAAVDADNPEDDGTMVNTTGEPPRATSDVRTKTVENELGDTTDESKQVEIIAQDGDEEPTQTVNPTQPSEGYNLRDREGRSYGHLKTVGYNNLNNGATERSRPSQVLHTYAMVISAILEYNKDESAYYRQVHETLLTQYGMKAGLKIFGQRGVDAIQKELQQFHDREVVKPVDPGDLTDEQRNKALAYLMFLKEKRCGKIKGRGCADGRKQRAWMNKEETASPTVSTTGLMLSCMIDAHEGRDVATADIPGAFLQTEDNSGDTHLRLDGIMLELLRLIDPKVYEPYIKTDKKGNKYMYVECLKAIYGTLNAALLFWLKLSSDLQSWGFEMNPYDWCVMNKSINDKQCTILWHVDDIKVSHIDANTVTDILNKIDNKYGKITPLVVTRGKIHDYLGMVIDFTTPNQVRFTMHDYIASMLEELPTKMGSGESVTPAGEHLFEVNSDDPEKLSEEDKVIFHTNAAKLLFLSKRARPDIQLPTSFLCTRVKDPDMDDWKKLVRVMKYLRGSIGLPLILGIDNTGVIRWHVDAAFAVHKDMRSHTGVTMTMGTGAAVSASSKQKLNTRSSTEAEQVGVDDAITQVIWTRYFMEAQGFPIADNIVYQDNQSAMKLEKNGKRSSGKRTRHMAIRYFFVTDRIAAGELEIEYCPTVDMIADYFTKPLQGGQFRKFRNTILGINEADIPSYNRNARHQIQQRRAKREEDALNQRSTT